MKKNAGWRRNLLISLIAGLAAAACYTAAFFLTGTLSARTGLRLGLIVLGGAGTAVLFFLILLLSAWAARMRDEELLAEEADREAHPEHWK